VPEKIALLSHLQEKGGSMFVLKVTMAQGRTHEQKEALIAQLSQAAALHLDWPLQDVRVAIYEVGDYEWGIGGRSIAARRMDSQSH
jgi:4-oxalocrotonate tautomerase